MTQMSFITYSTVYMLLNELSKLTGIINIRSINLLMCVMCHTAHTLALQLLELGKYMYNICETFSHPDAWCVYI